MLNLTRRTDQLERYHAVSFFSSWTDKELEHLHRVADLVDFEPGEVLAGRRGTTREFMVVLNGSASVEHGGRVVRDLGPGDCLGELELLSRPGHQPVVRAGTNLQAVSVGPREFYSLLGYVPALGRSLAIRLARRLAEHPPAA
jgi:CRP-like cAMP-binding protein